MHWLPLSFRMYARSCAVDDASTGMAMPPFFQMEKKEYIHPSLFSEKMMVFLSAPLGVRVAKWSIC